MYHYVYRIDFILTEEYYIGKHSTDNLQDGYLGSGSRLQERYDNGQPYVFSIISTHSSEDEAYEAEKKLIGNLWDVDDKCLNKIPGGRTGIPDNMKGVPMSNGHKLKIAKANSKPKVGKALEAAIRNSKLGSEARRGMRDSEAVCKKRADSLSRALKGVKQPKNQSIYVIDGIEYIGTEQVKKKFGLSLYRLNRRIKSKDWPTWIMVKGKLSEREKS